MPASGSPTSVWPAPRGWWGCRRRAGRGSSAGCRRWRRRRPLGPGASTSSSRARSSAAEQGQIVGHQGHAAGHADGQRPRPGPDRATGWSRVGAQHEAVGVVQPEPAVQERPGQRRPPGAPGRGLGLPVARHGRRSGGSVAQCGPTSGPMRMPSTTPTQRAQRRAAAQDEGVLARAPRGRRRTRPGPARRASASDRRTGPRCLARR